MAKNLKKLSHRHGFSKLFNDFTTMVICSYHRVNIQSRLQSTDEANENRYFDSIAGYKDDELLIFSQALADAMVSIYDTPYSDPFGEFFMEYVSNGQNGQFFTPEPVCEMMTLINGEKGSVIDKRVLDPACGSGRTLLSFAKHNPYNHFYGADVSELCAKMTTINMFFNGMKGEVAWMDSLSMDWYGGWSINQDGLGILPIDKEDSALWQQPPEIIQPELEKAELPSESGNDQSAAPQLTLF